MTTEDEKEVNLSGDNDKQISAFNYVRKLNQIVFPEYVHGRDDHDEFCMDLRRERDHALGKGIKDEDIADYLHYKMRKTSLRKSFMIELGKIMNPRQRWSLKLFKNVINQNLMEMAMIVSRK